jgi:hypothetical protein
MTGSGTSGSLVPELAGLHRTRKDHPMADDSGQITEFDKSQYDMLISHLTIIDQALNTLPSALGPSADLKLDSSLSSKFHPGSQDWAVAKNFVTQATTFATSAHNRYTATESDVRSFYKALKEAEKVFEETDDLASYDASKFSRDHPDVSATSKH